MEVLVLNSKFESLTVIDTFKSLIWTDRLRAYGDFELYLSMEPGILNYLKEDNYLWMKESEHCMIIENIAIDSDAEEGNHLTVTGRSLESILERRIVWGQKIAKGRLEEGFRQLLDICIMNPDLPDRKIDNFIFKPSGDAKVASIPINAQFDWTDLYVAVTKQCESNGIGFKIVLNDDNKFAFSFYTGTDRSYSQTKNPYVIFSPNFENIINSNYYYSKANLKNVTLVVGEGKSPSFKTATVGSGSGLNRREIFTDARGVSSDTENGTLTAASYTALLEASGRENLAGYTTKTAFEGEVEATRLFKYGEDFFIGDIVQVANEYGHEGRAYISEIVFSQSKEGISIYPTFQFIQ